MNKYKLISRLTAPVIVWALALPAMAQITPTPIRPETSFTKEALVETLVSLANWALGLISIVAVFMILYGGFIYMTTAGDEAKIEKGKSIIIYGIVGVIIAILAFAVVSFADSLLG